MQDDASSAATALVVDKNVRLAFSLHGTCVVLIDAHTADGTTRCVALKHVMGSVLVTQGASRDFVVRYLCDLYEFAILAAHDWFDIDALLAGLHDSAADDSSDAPGLASECVTAAAAQQTRELTQKRRAPEVRERIIYTLLAELDNTRAYRALRTPLRAIIAGVRRHDARVCSVLECIGVQSTMQLVSTYQLFQSARELFDFLYRQSESSAHHVHSADLAGSEAYD